jgi:hypothetical protein
MVKLLPIPSLKKVRITKTKIPTNKSPQDSQSQKKISSQDMMLQNAHGPIPIATFAVTFPEDPKKEILGFVLVFPVPTGQEEKESSPVPESPRAPAEKLQDRIVLGLLVSIGFVCFAIC